MRAYVDDVVLVDEEQIRAGLRVARDALGLLLEPAGALGLAAALGHRSAAERPAAVVTASDYAPAQLAELLAGD